MANKPPSLNTTSTSSSSPIPVVVVMSEIDYTCEKCGKRQQRIGYTLFIPAGKNLSVCAECKEKFAHLEQEIPPFRCPKCDRVVIEYPATSRIDGKTKICSECGKLEAVDEFERSTGIIIPAGADEILGKKKGRSRKKDT